MELHEYQAKEILKEFGVPTPPFFVASSVREVEEQINKQASLPCVLKVQVHAGGRGKAGGVKIAKTKDELKEHAKNLIGMRIVNIQTGPDGRIAKKILISNLVEIVQEFYFAITIDRKKKAVSIIVSKEGGVEIEELAAKSPEKILVESIVEGKVLRQYQLLRIAKFLGWLGEDQKLGLSIITSCLKAFFALDAQLLEINPLVKTADGTFFALDAKLSIDDNALFRQKALQAYFDPSQITEEEARAIDVDLAYVSLNGKIGCMVNGAGLAMATMDLIRLCGEDPANFLDVGGGASQEKVAEGLKIILQDAKVQAVLVNIFGGIMNCETIASALIDVHKNHGIQVPIVVRLEGTNVEPALQMLEKSGMNFISGASLDDAAKKVVKLVPKR